MRGAHAFRTRAGPSGLAAWFAYSWLGMHTGLSEGVILDAGGSLAQWPLDLADETGGDLLKLTRLTPGYAPDSPRDETVRFARWTLLRRRMPVYEVLSLASTYEATLNLLGRHTRRNMRKARRAASEHNWRFEPAQRLPDRALAALASKTRPERPKLRLLRRLEAYADLSGEPFRTLMRDADGRVISYACGFIGESSTAHLLYQLNDPAWNDVGPSLLHRAFLTEWLIEAGCRELVFVHGCSGILRHACTKLHAEELLIMRRRLSAYVLAGAIAAIRPRSSVGSLARSALAEAWRPWRPLHETLCRAGVATVSVLALASDSV